MADESLSAIAVADPAPAPRAERGPVDAVADQLENFLTEQRARLARLDPALAPLLRTATDAVLAGGKRMRPTFAHRGWRAAAGPEAPLSHVLPALAALELMHAFALVHDDIMDASLTRRGRPTAHVALAHAPPVRPGTLGPLGKRRRVEAAVSGPGHVVVVGAGLGGAGSCRRHTVLGHAHARPDRAVPRAQRPSTTVQCGVRRLRDDARCRRAHGHHLRKACLRPAHGTPHRSVTGTPPVGRTRHARPTGGPITKGATMGKAQQLWGLAVFALAVTVVAVTGSLAAIDAGAEYNALRQPSWAPRRGRPDPAR